MCVREYTEHARRFKVEKARSHSETLLSGYLAMRFTLMVQESPLLDGHKG